MPKLGFYPLLSVSFTEMLSSLKGVYSPSSHRKRDHFQKEEFRDDYRTKHQGCTRRQGKVMWCVSVNIIKLHGFHWKHTQEIEALELSNGWRYIKKTPMHIVLSQAQVQGQPFLMDNSSP